MWDKAMKTVINLGDLAGGGDQVHTCKAVKTLDKLFEVGINAGSSDQVYMPLCQNVYALMSIVYGYRSQIYAFMATVYVNYCLCP